MIGADDAWECSRVWMTVSINMNVQVRWNMECTWCRLQDILTIKHTCTHFAVMVWYVHGWRCCACTESLLCCRYTLGTCWHRHVMRILTRVGMSSCTISARRTPPSSPRTTLSTFCYANWHLSTTPSLSSKVRWVISFRSWCSHEAWEFHICEKIIFVNQ